MVQKSKAGEKAVTGQVAQKTKGPKSCGCGCGGMTRGGQFIPGHDAKLLSRLLKAAGAGDAAAKAELISHGWARQPRVGVAKEKGSGRTKQGGKKVATVTVESRKIA